MKKLLLPSSLILIFVGCGTPDRTITDPAGASRPWGSANIESNYSAAPVSSSTDTEKHIWTLSPIPTVPPIHDDWRAD